MYSTWWAVVAAVDVAGLRFVMQSYTDWLSIVCIDFRMHWFDAEPLQWGGILGWDL
jgi:hypothetical protein